MKNHVGDQARVTRLRLPRNNGRLADGGVVTQNHFNFGGFDAEAAYFELVVQSPGMDQRAIGAPEAKVAGAVKPGAWLGGEWVRHKPLRGQRGAAGIVGGNARPADADFTLGTDGHDGARRIEDMDLRVVYGAADADDGVAGVYLAGSGPDRGFRWSVHVPYFAGARQQGAGENPKLLAAVPARLDEHAPGGRRGLHDGGSAGGQKARQGGAILCDVPGNQFDAGTCQQRQIKFQCGDIEGQRGDRGHDIAGRYTGRFAHGAEQVQQRAVGDGNTFRPACGSGCVNNIGNVVRRGAGGEVASRRAGPDGNSRQVELLQAAGNA